MLLLKLQVKCRKQKLKKQKKFERILKEDFLRSINHENF